MRKSSQCEDSSVATIMNLTGEDQVMQVPLNVSHGIETLLLYYIELS